MFYIIIIMGIVLLEKIIKDYMETNRELGVETVHWKGTLILEKYHNKGVALNILEKHVNIVKIITGTMIGILLVVLGMLIKGKSNRFYKMGLALLLGGAISNWLDRLERGYVVDYFKINKGKKLKHIIFNIADLFVFLGGILIILGELISSDH